MPAKKNGKATGRRGEFLYKSYSFKTKDPVIDRMRTIVQDEGVSYQDLHLMSGVSVAAMRGWWEGETRRPQYATVAAVTSALGYKQEFVKARKVDFEREIAKAKREIEEAAA